LKGGYQLKEKRIVFTGGGSAGHVTVNLALIPTLIQEGWDVAYIGSETGIEKQLTQGLSGVRYYSISTGKLRRYLDWNNATDPFKVMKGVFQAFKIIRKLNPDVIFSKGGFVSVPVILGAWLNKVPTIIHESDITPGLANKISIPFVTKVCTTFPETVQYLRSSKAVHIGAVVREELKKGNANQGLRYCHFIKDKPVLLIMGGSLGSHRMNQAVRNNLHLLLSDFQIIHICGKGNIDSSIHEEEYKQYEYVNTELPDLMAMSDMVISRAGSNSIFEFLALRKPMLLIPLSQRVSRGDQILNAKSFKESGYCEVLLEEEITDERFIKTVYQVFENKLSYIECMKKNNGEGAKEKVLDLIRNLST
jgi:UDP-N-acetylglucosamine--N-acetylmuramyl-(pentapeptide) pyrophosphoryl-undecaprenol N-acetylglucosamine transferase